MDLATVTDIKELKSLAYDELAQKEQSERNLHAINTRISELLQAEQTTDKNKDEAPADKPAK